MSDRTLLDMVHSMMSYAQLPDSFWGHTVETAIYILNNVHSKSVLEHFPNCGEGIKVVYITSEFGDAQHMCWCKILRS